MEEKDDVLDNLFDKKEDDDLFNLDDEELVRLDKALEEMKDKLDKFIYEEISPDNREKTKKYFKEYSSLLFKYMRKENQLFYKNGIADGIKILLFALTN